MMEYLSLNEVANLIGCDMDSCRMIKRSIMQTPRGKILIYKSKRYHTYHADWWYSIDIESIKENKIDFVCFIADVTGIFLIPAESILDYSENNHVNKVKSGRENFIIEIVGKEYLRYAPYCEDWNLAKYFILAK